MTICDWPHSSELKKRKSKRGRPSLGKDVKRVQLNLKVRPDTKKLLQENSIKYGKSVSRLVEDVISYNYWP